MKKSLVYISCLLILITASNLPGQNAQSEYSIVNKIHLPGDGGRNSGIIRTIC